MIGSTIYWQYQVNGIWSSWTYQWTDSSYATGGVGIRTASAGATNHHHLDDVALTTTYNYTHDEANQLTMVKDSPANTLSTLAYDASGNTAFDGASYTHDQRNRLTSVENAASGSVAYTHDAMGRLLTRSARTKYIAEDFSQGYGSWLSSTNTSWSLAMGLGDSVLKGDGLAGATATRKSAGAVSDYTLSARVKITSTNNSSATAGLVFRSNQPAPPSVDSNEYYLGIYPGESKWKLFRVASGTFGAAVASGNLTINLNQYYTLSVRAQGSRMRIFIDGIEQNAASPYSDSNPHTYTSVGLRSRNAIASFDDVRVIGLTYNASTTYRYLDVTGDFMHELDASGNVKVTYVSDSQGNPVSVTRYNNGTATTFFYHYNAHGDVTAITDATGAVIARFSYDPWGIPTEYNGATGARQAIGSFAGSAGDGLFILFGGMLYDAAAGIYLTYSPDRRDTDATAR